MKKLTPTQQRCLMALAGKIDPVNSNVVARLAGIEGRMTHLGAISACQGLERRGLVKCIYAPGDATYMWQITKEGWRAINDGAVDPKNLKASNAA